MEKVGENPDGTALLQRTANYTKVQGFNSVQIAGMQTLNGLVGGLTSNAVGFLMVNVNLICGYSNFTTYATFFN